MQEGQQQPGLRQDALQSLKSTDATIGRLDDQASIDKHLEDQIIEVEAQNETLQILIQVSKFGGVKHAKLLFGKLRSKASLEDILVFVRAQRTYIIAGFPAACSLKGIGLEC